MRSKWEDLKFYKFLLPVICFWLPAVIKTQADNKTWVWDLSKLVYSHLAMSTSPAFFSGGLIFFKSKGSIKNRWQ